MFRNRHLIAVSCLAILGLLLASCAPAVAPSATPKAAAPPAAAATTAAPSAPKPAAPAPSPKPATEQPRYGGILTIGMGGDPPSFDIHQEDTNFTFALTAATYNNLLKPDPESADFKPVADLATSWQVSTDGKVYTFNLVKGAKFHDGAPLTAEDVKFSLDRIRDPKFGLAKSPKRQDLAAIAIIDAPDDSTARITLKYPQASFIQLIATVYRAIMPKHVVLEKKHDMRKTVVGSGSFKFKDYATGVGWELVKNPDYFVKGRPYLDGVKAYIIVDPFTRFAALRTRNIVWWAPSPVMTVSQARIIEETLSDKIALDWRFQPSWYGMVFNLTKPRWNDVRVRQAVSMTFDRKRMVAVGLEGAGIVGMSAQPPGEWALPEAEMEKMPGYAKPDLEGAKKLLAEAGFPNGFKAEILVRGITPHQNLAVLVKDVVAAIGIDLDLKVVETTTFKDMQFRKAFDVEIAGLSSAVLDPDTYLGDCYVTGSPNNWGSYNNPYYDELYMKQVQAVDPAERRKIVWEMQRILLRDVPIAIAYWVKIPYAWWKEVKGFTPPVGWTHAYNTYQDMWLAK
ncbi:MAG: ABC transporter substrate-binding protein [Chloroflexi bacterium]|nr:ABC transporter substrate-binding protein [Chloroflexota bacterium]